MILEFIGFTLLLGAGTAYGDTFIGFTWGVHVHIAWLNVMIGMTFHKEV